MGVGYLWFSPAKYESTVELLVDPRPRAVVDAQSVPTGLGSSSIGADTALVESQVDIMTSRSVLSILIDRFGLLTDPEFGDSTSDPSFVSGLIRAVIYGPNTAAQAPLSPQDKAMEMLERAIKVGRAGNTYVLQITAKTGSAQKSADIANELAAIYLEQIQGAANSASTESAVFIESRLTELKTAADEAQRAVEDYRALNGLISADSLPIGEQQLRDIAAQITQATIASDAARADLDEVNRLAASPSSAGVSNALSSPAIDNLRLQLEVARSEENARGASLGPKHPQMVLASETRAGIQAALTAEYERLVTQTESRYQAALAREQSLRVLLNQYESRQGIANAASVTLEELQRVASSKIKIYETFLGRALEVREQVASPASTARTISPAVVSSRPSEPRLVMVLTLASVAGLTIGIGLAWLQHLLFGTPGQRPVSTPRPHLAPIEAERTPRPIQQSVSTPKPKIVARRRPGLGLFR